MNWKKLIPLNVLTVLMLLLSPFLSSSAFGDDSGSLKLSDTTIQQGEELLINERQQVADDLKEELGYGEIDGDQSKAYKPNEKVRVIVEVADPKTPQKISKKDQKLQMKRSEERRVGKESKARRRKVR